MIEHPVCPLCHHTDRRFIIGSWQDAIGVARCTACGLVHTTGRHASAEPRTAPVRASKRRMVRVAFEHRDRLLGGRLRMPTPDATVLDIGCGDGSWLDEMKLRGYRTEGTHTAPTPATAQHRVYAVDCSDGGANLGRVYDVVTLLDRLHLVARPAAALHFAARHLAPGGVVIIEVPNWNHRRQPYGLPTGVRLGHQVAFYDRDSLRDAVRAVGLEPLSICSAPAHVTHALHVTRTQSKRSSRGWFGRALGMTERLLQHVSDASDHGATLVLVAHRPDPDAH